MEHTALTRELLTCVVDTDRPLLEYFGFLPVLCIHEEGNQKAQEINDILEFNKIFI